jgi:putative oxidoreductase
MHKKIVNIVAILFGAAMVFSGAIKFGNFPPPQGLTPVQVEAYHALFALKWLVPLVAVAEIVGGVLFAIPKTRALGALVVLPIVVGIVMHNAVYDVKGLIIAGVFLAINVWIIVVNKNKYKPILG